MPQHKSGSVSLLLAVEKFLKSVNIWQGYKQERGCFVHFLLLLAVWCPGSQSARNHRVLICNFAKYLPIKNFFH